MTMSGFDKNPAIHLQNLILDTSGLASKEQKIDCLKLLKIVVKNLADPEKSINPKFRQLRLSNEKVEKKLLPCPSSLLYLETIGFKKVTEDDGSVFLRILDDVTVNLKEMEASLQEILNAIQMLDPQTTTSTSVASSRLSSTIIPIKRRSNFSEEKKTPEGILIREKPISAKGSVATAKMSEKQKARLLMEKKRKKEEEDAKAQRAKTAAMIKQDKFVRKHDENWKSGVSAACVKSGEGISTFRDKYGEN